MAEPIRSLTRKVAKTAPATAGARPVTAPAPTPAPRTPAPRLGAARDLAIAVTLAAAAGFSSYVGWGEIDSAVLTWPALDTWFEADVPRVFANMTMRQSDHYRTSVHPLLSLTMYSGVKGIRWATGLGPVAAARLFTAATAALWIAAVYALLRVIGCRRFDATLFSILAAASASAVFWLVVPESYPLGSLSILLALIVVAIAERRGLSPLWFAAASALSLSFTLTNWMAGLLASWVSLSWRRALRVSIAAFGLVLALWCGQKALFPSAGFFLSLGEEQSYLLHPETGGPLPVVKSFFLHTLVMPEFEDENRYQRPDWPVLHTQASAPGSGSLWGAIAIFVWGALLAGGLGALFFWRQHPRFRAVLFLTLLGQLGLHLLYGEETFLYSLHFAPLLVALAALSTFTRARLPALAAAGLLIALAAANNGRQLARAAEFLHSHGSPRRHVLSAMEKRPGDPWPRGDGHVVLAYPGSPASAKGYHEPGGSFSPAPNTFGVALWVTGADGAVLRTSDGIPLDEVRQRFDWRQGTGLPSIHTETPDYQASWSAEAPGRWRLDLDSRAVEGTRLAIAVRSVGPAGGPVRSLAWDGDRLLVNDIWGVRVEPAPSAVHLVDENIAGWTRAAPGLSSWTSPPGKGPREGWGCARLELVARQAGSGAAGAAAGSWRVYREGPAPPALPSFHAVDTRAQVEVDLPDPEFKWCLDAQTAHLLMSLVGGQTRSSDPVNVPVPWQRTGAYIITALAAAGHLQPAKDLARFLAENDFYGGFGAEGDAPGLGLWALEEVAARAADPAFDAWLWPHVRRKAEWILAMMAAEKTLRARVANPIVPRHWHRPDAEQGVVADPPVDGLIQGRMDFHRPALYITAVSHRGLLDAAALAERLEHRDEAALWRTKAAALKAAWEQAFVPEPTQNDRTYISGLWPSWIAVSSRPRFLEGLEDRWSRARDVRGGFRERPPWTYFELAAAHQHLFLGKPERVWSTIRWFRENEASPDLYTWWEGADEGNSYDCWDRLRGWVKPPSSQPHYWTSAEMLLLQLDMLVHADLSGTEPAVVIGAGVPREWIERPLAARGVWTRLGRVDWEWRDGKARVVFHGKKRPVRLGPSFPARAPVRVERG